MGRALYLKLNSLRLQLQHFHHPQRKTGKNSEARKRIKWMAEIDCYWAQSKGPGYSWFICSGGGRNEVLFQPTLICG